MPNHVRHVFAAITLTLFAALGASRVAAQSNATISGTVADTSSAAIPGATVQITNAETGAVQTRVTDAQGRGGEVLQ